MSSQRLKGTKGFTLVELIVVIAILAMLVAIAVPAMTGYVDTASQTVCEANRKGLERYWRTASIQHMVDGGGELTLTQFMSSTEPEHKENITSHRCPSNGVISVSSTGDTLDCSIHGGGTGGSGTGGGGTGGGGTGGGGTGGGGTGGGTSTVPGTDIPLRGSGWPKDDDFDAYNEYRFTAGDVFEHNGSYYVITNGISISRGNAAGGPDAVLVWDFLEKFTGKQWGKGDIDADGRIVRAVHGDLYVDETGSYVFRPNSGGNASTPPAIYPAQWFKVK